MDDQELRKLLENLHAEIQRTHNVDEKGRELLRDLDGDINELLKRSDNLSESPNPSAVSRVEETIYHFEASHNRLTDLLAKLLAVMGNAGI